ncbi:MAG: peptide chain release factor 1 [Alphaproteobacteria bacterium]|nr:peptide chain release factor 1 [Alphaproteobacteria bacterium]
MFDRLDVIEGRYEELNRMLMDPALAADPSRLREVTIEHAEISPVVDAYRELKGVQSELADMDELLADPEMREMAQEEKASLTAREAELTDQLRVLLLPKDPYAGRNLLLEIRAGTGGDEAALFAGDLFRMYHRFAEAQGLKVEVLSSSEVAVGGSGGRTAQGFKEVICLVSGASAYSHLKYESGVHRVQRVPVTETQGRIHTSAATVAVLAEPEEVEVHVSEADLRVDVFRASGPGGQSVNTTDSAVRITHIPSGLVVICQDEKSQHKNKAKAMKVLKARLFDQMEAERHAEEAAERRSQVGSGDRSERIRTYNYPQNRVTDHRINLTLYKLDRIVEGDLAELLTALQAHYQAKAIEDAGL